MRSKCSKHLRWLYKIMLDRGGQIQKIQRYQDGYKLFISYKPVGWTSHFGRSVIILTTNIPIRIEND